jgi:hypothetical protein
MLAVLWTASCCGCHAFVVTIPTAVTTFYRPHCSVISPRDKDIIQKSKLFAANEPPGDDLEEDAESIEPNSPPLSDETIVTREMFQKELLKDPVVRRKKNNKGGSTPQSYKLLDNRDSLPFQIEHSTPDPYTHPEVKRKQANKVRKKAGSIENQLASSLYTSSNDSGDDDDEQSSKTLLGEFVLDKYTTTGDILEIGDVQYRVVKHKCQYKYAGGKRFVMVRKILQVKEIGRLQQEEYLKRQWQQSS